MDNVEEISRNSLNWEDFFGSSLELAPSLLNLYDHTIATGTKDKVTSNDHINDKNVSKPRSLPSQPHQDSLDEVQYRSERLHFQKFPAERPVSMMNPGLLVDNKKRPLSISSVSSTSLTSSPRLRKKRANPLIADNTGIMRGDSQDSDCTLIPDCSSDPPIISSSESRQSVDSGCVEGEKNGDRYADSVSVTSSETGSCKDVTDNSTKDCSVMSSPLVNKLNSVQLLRQSRGSDVTCDVSASPTEAHESIGIATGGVPSSKTSSPNRQAKHVMSLEQTNKSKLPSELQSFDINSPRTVPNTSDSPKHTCSSPNSRQEARMKFFSNYEEYTRQPFSLPASIAEENIERASSPVATPRNDISKVPPPSLQSSPPAAAASEAGSHQTRPSQNPFPKNPLPPTSPVLKPEHRDRSSQLSTTSEKPSRKSERHGSVSKHERQPTSPRTGFSRVSKKKDSHAASDLGSKSSPVYVSYVSRVVSEIIESERIYIASLKDIIHGYLEPMENILDSEDFKKDIACLFSNIREIYKFGCTFLSDLEAACADPVKVAQCFVKYNKGFVIYTDYCTNYPRAVEVLTRFMQHPSLSQLCKERQHSLGHALPLGAYLLKPVQRILKYHLLLHNIVKNCEKEKEEAAILEKAFHHMTQMAHHINEMKRKHEHAVRIQEIQSQLEDYVGEDLTRLGELVLEGAFKVNGAKASRQVFLFEKGLLISKLKEGGMLSCKTFIPCSNLMLIEVIPNDPLSFHIIPFDNPRGQDTLQARNMEQKRRWCHDIKQQILESFKGRIPDNAKNLIMQLGKDWNDDYLSRDTLDSGKRNQHNAPEYLEKRRFRRKSGSRLPDFSLLIPQKTKKGGNKKNETQSEEKRTPRRSESKSPERHRRLFSKQNSATKNRSRSISSSSISLPTTPTTHLPDQAAIELKPISQTVENSSPKSTCQSPESPVYKKSPKKLIYPLDGRGAVEAEPDIIRRPASFLLARGNPILSEDITNLLARCGGNFKILNSPSLVNEQCGDFPSICRLEMRNKSNDSEECLNNNVLNAAEDKGVQSNETIMSEPFSEVLVNAPYFETSQQISNSTAIVSSQKNMKESEQLKSRLRTSLDLRNTTKDNSLDTSEAEHKECNKLDLQGLENVYENLSMAESTVSRRDMLKNPSLRQKCKSEVTFDTEVERWKKEYEMMVSGATNKKTAGENILLKKKGLRLPNTSKLLSARENELSLYTNQMRHKMTSSEGTLNTGCVRDTFFLNENPFVKSVHTSSTSFADSKLPLSFASRPRGYSDLAEYNHISVNKENQHLLHRNISTPLYQCSDRKEDLEKEVKYLSQFPYATPPRDYMTIERMKRACSLRDTCRPSDNFCTFPTSGAVSALSISPMAVTVAKPVSLNTSNLLRSKSTIITNEREESAEKTSPNKRPVSMDVDKLTEESNKLIAEMEEYISNSYENVKSINKFPTSLPAISVEEEEPHSNRLSMVSTISTSSYESQGSSSSDGLVGTLKSKLRAWARMRNDSEYSFPSAVTSDDEEQTNSESGSAFGLLSKNMSSWRDDSDYDIAHLDYTFSEPVSGMEHTPMPQSREQMVSSQYEEPSVSESLPHQDDSSITDSYPCDDSSFMKSHCVDHSFSESHPGKESSITGSHSYGDFISESHSCEDSSIAEMQPCEDYVSDSQLYENSLNEPHPSKDSCITETHSCRDYINESHPNEDSSVTKLQPCEDSSMTGLQPYKDYIRGPKLCDNSFSEPHPCEDSSITGLQPYEDYIREPKLCDNSLSEPRPCEDSSAGGLYPCEHSSICQSHQQENIDFDDGDMASEKSKTLTLETEYQPEQIEFSHLQIPSSSANKSGIIQSCDPNLYLQRNQLSTRNSHPLNITAVAKNEQNLLQELFSGKATPAEHSTEVVKPVKENSLFEINGCHKQCGSDTDYCDREIPTESNLEFESKILENIDNDQQEGVNVEYPRRSIREFVQNFEEMQRAESMKVLEVKRREPGLMIRQRLKSLRESSLHGWRNSSPCDEDHQFEGCNSPPPTDSNQISSDKCNGQKELSAASNYTNLLDSKNSMSKSVENLRKSQENINLPGVCLNFIPSISYSRHSIPFCNMKSNHPSHEADICELHYKTSDNQASSGNQFIHRVPNGSQQSVSSVHSSLESPSVPWTHSSLESPSVPWAHSSLESPLVPWAHSSLESPSVPWAHSSLESPSVPWAHSSLEPPSVPWAHSSLEPPSVPWAHSSLESPSVPWVHSGLEPPLVPWAHSHLESSVPIAETLPSTASEAASMQSSNPSSVFDATDSEEENLVKMKGWVKALISKFQDKD